LDNKIISAIKRYYWSLRQKKSKFNWPGKSGDYWEARYAEGGSSGSGSYGKLANFKAEVLNDFISRKGVGSVIEFGCGDGNQLTLGRYPRYLGLDVSATAISMCKQLFATDSNKEFRLVSDYREERADLCLSLDVIYHLVEDSAFEPYMHMLFSAADRYVIIYSSDFDQVERAVHVRHRHFSKWVDEHIRNWTLVDRIPNRYPDVGGSEEGSFADFFIYEKQG